MSVDPELPELKTDPRHGYYPWWPQDGDDWVHPEDVQLARSLIPSPRIWRRDGESGAFHVLHYGELRLRVKPALWREAPFEGFEVGDPVEVLPRGMQNEPFTGVVRDVHWDAHAGGVRYFVTTSEGAPYERPLTASDLKPSDAPRPSEQIRLEPSGEDADDLIDGPAAPKEPW